MVGCSGREESMQALGWGSPAERSVWAAVEFGCDGGEVVSAVDGHPQDHVVLAATRRGPAELLGRRNTSHR
ncbi:hypothetical protein [Streptomyces sp. G-G2]|uniref:hypothetical protein n=1 Tax=Streptomyces sp. G-G2 TaxID=3046201 RepID=UPI0024BA1C01|nr:hypothetical protein [Streptomyces sp. G-G2]MDJ0380156.1 hypothetical protein [Streptomyces sp. G-G2]